MSALVRMGLVMTMVVVMGACATRSAEAAGDVAAAIDGDRVVVTVAGKEFTSYKFSDSLKKPYLWPLAGPKSGKSVTTESSEPYPHHNSLFFGCDHVNGGNYWQDVNDRGQIVSEGPKIVEASGDRAVFTDTCLWKRPGEEPVIRDHRRVTVSAPNEELRYIDFEITLDMLTDVTVTTTNHSLFSARVTAELNVDNGGTLVNAEGARDHKGTHGKPSPWCDYHGSWDDGVTEGVAIFQHPGNLWYPSPWFTRDYGFFSPTPMQWLEDGKITFAKGEKVALKYRVVVHSGDTEEAGIAALWKEYEAAAKSGK
jgi:Family of unknown function (DUF6807)